MNKNKVNKQEYNNQVKRKELINKIIYCVTLFFCVYFFFFIMLLKNLAKFFIFIYHFDFFFLFNGILNLKCL